MAWLASGIVYSLAYLVGGWLLRGHSALLLYFRIIALLVPPLTGIGVITRRRQDWSGCHWLFWATLALGLMMSAIGLVGWTVDDLLLDRQASWLGWYAVFGLFGGVAPLFALLAQPHRGRREELTATTAVDIAGIAVMAGFLYSHFVVSPDLSPITAQRPSFALLVLCEFQQLIVCAGVTAAAFVARNLPWGRTYQRLAMGLFVNLIILSITNAEIWQGMYRPGFVYDVIWIMPFAFFPWAAATAPASEDSAPEGLETAEVSRPWVVFGALCLVPVLDFGLRAALPLGALDGFRDLFMVITIFSVLPLLLARLAVERGDARQADGKRRLLAAATEQANDLISIVSPDGRIDHANGSFCRAVGSDLREVVGSPTAQFLADESQGHIDAAAEAITRDGVWHGTIARRRKDGSTFPSSSAVVALSDEHGGITHFVAVERDVTNEVQLRDQRKRHEAELQRAKEVAESANRAKSEFLANMSHEIRTPMNGVIGMTELVLDTGLTDEQRECLETVKISAHNLLGILNDILDFSKIESRKLDLEAVPVALADLITETLKPLAVRAHQKGLELVSDVAPDVPSGILGDPVRLRQIIANLVGNAIKFTERGQILLTVQCETRSAAGCGLHFIVADSGPGIPKEKHTAIFEAFSQADGSTTRRFGGTGLGLTISSNLVHLMQGRIWVESEPGQGSTFHFVIEFPVADLETTETRNPALIGLPVLIVDDNAVNRRVLQQQLTRWQMRPTAVDGGQAALEELTNAVRNGRPYPLVLLDANMPDLDGFDVAERIGDSDALPRATIMMLSSSGQLGDAAKCRELGVAAHLTKPVGQTDLFNAICRALARSTTRLTDIPGMTASITPVKVLLAEDNPINERVAVGVLSRRGHQVVVAHTGLEAIAAFEHETFDTILMDIEMPDMSGLDAVAAIRERERHGGAGHVWIVAMTAHARVEDRARCLLAGMDGYLSKPIDRQLLFDTVEHHGTGLDPSALGQQLEPA